MPRLPSLAWSLLILLPGIAAVQEATVTELETFVVSGERPGPALWKVRRKDHTLWILPTFGPLPRGLVWRSTQVEDVIRESQQVYADARMDVLRPSGRGIDMRLMKALANDNGGRLRNVMPTDLYRQFTKLSERYVGNAVAFEFFRPFQATDLLRGAAMERLGLTSDGNVLATVHALADQHGVPLLAPRPIENRDWDKIISQLEKTPREADLPCAQARLDRLETDLWDSIARANAWGSGDITTLRNDPGLHADGTDIAACEQFFRHMKFTRQRMLELRKQSYSLYVKALKKNHSTLVLASITDLFDKDGLIARFKAAGYQVEEP